MSALSCIKTHPLYARAGRLWSLHAFYGAQNSTRCCATLRAPRIPMEPPTYTGGTHTCRAIVCLRISIVRAHVPQGANAPSIKLHLKWVPPVGAVRERRFDSTKRSLHSCALRRATFKSCANNCCYRKASREGASKRKPIIHRDTDEHRQQTVSPSRRVYLRCPNQVHHSFFSTSPTPRARHRTSAARAASRDVMVKWSRSGRRNACALTALCQVTPAECLREEGAH